MVISTETPNCILCKIEFECQEDFEQHKTSPNHRVKWLKHWYQNNRLLLAKDKYGIKIFPGKSSTPKIKFAKRTGSVSLELVQGKPATFDLVVSNSEAKPVILRNVELLHSCKYVTLQDDHGVTRKDKYVRIPQDINYAVEVRAHYDNHGVTQVPVAFQFTHENTHQPFFIVRTIEISVKDAVAEDSVATSPYQPFQPAPRRSWARESAVPGVKPRARGGAAPHVPKVPLPHYDIPNHIRAIAPKDFDPKKVPRQHQDSAKAIVEMLKEGLSVNNYTKWFQTLMWCEELQMELDISYYNMSQVPLRDVPRNRYSAYHVVELEVPGLAENRPSVLYGDSVYVWVPGQRVPYEGCVHQVLEKSVYLGLNQSFMESFLNNMKVDVEFSFNRYPLRVSHRAVSGDPKKNLATKIFPTKPKNVTKLQKFLPYNRNLQNNPEQRLAVQHILAGSSGAAPYVIFGPPGTGKTVTIVEAMKQIHKKHRDSKILCTSTSNSAADIIAVRLLDHIPAAQVLRINASSRNINTIPEKVRQCSNVMNGYYFDPTMEHLNKARFIVTTFVTAARLLKIPVPKDFFSHAFLDECGHAPEPEAVAVFSGLLGPGASLVLSGDPQQLGPVVRRTQCLSESPLFKGNGLDKSFLERLMEMEVYKVGGAESGLVVTKLKNNYRSHEAILNMPNQMFYDNELRVAADPVYVSAFCHWEHLPAKNFPVIFHGVRGKDEREGNSPSYFNVQEVSAVVDYVKKLLDSRNPKVQAKDIGIITPYRKQVEKIRRQIAKVPGSAGLVVGSPEEFQGDERRVILISTVRATQDRMAEDLFYKLGFVGNRKRFNVAVTRAKALLIVVGCPDVLIQDEHWGQFLEYVKAKGGYRGPSFNTTADEGTINDILQRFGDMKLNPMEYGGIGAKQLAEAPVWRADS